MSTASNLYQLQEIENSIANLEKERLHIEKSLSFNQELNNAQAELEEKQSRQSAILKEQRTTELDLAGLTQKVEESEKELYSGKIANPKELANLQLDIDNINKKRRGLEERALELMEEGEQLNRQSEDCQQKGIGAQLVEACLQEAKELGLPTVFCLTYKPAFFEKFGFSQVEKTELPHKVWGECYLCPKFPNCDEVALIYHFKAGA